MLSFLFWHLLRFYQPVLSFLYHILCVNVNNMHQKVANTDTAFLPLSFYCLSINQGWVHGGGDKGRQNGEAEKRGEEEEKGKKKLRRS